MNLIPDSQIFKIISNTIALQSKRNADVVLVITTHTLAYLKDNCKNDIQRENIFDSIFACFDYYNSFIKKNCLNLPKITQEDYNKIKNEYMAAEEEVQ